MEEILEAQEIRAKGESIIQQAWERCQALVPRLDYLKQNQAEESAEDKQAIIRLLVDKVTVNSKGEVSINLAIPKLESVGVYCMPPLKRSNTINHNQPLFTLVANLYL